MQGYSYKSVKKVKLDPVEGCVALHLHGVLSTNLKRGSSITYLHSRLIISSQIEEVLIVVWDKIDIAEASRQEMDDNSTELAAIKKKTKMISAAL